MTLNYHLTRFGWWLLGASPDTRGGIFWMNLNFYNKDHPFKTSACLRGVGGSPWADGQKVTVHKDQKSPS